MRLGLLTLGDLITDPVTGRRHTAATRHRSIIEQAVLAEASGFSSVHLGEHHFMEYILSAPQIVLAAIAERTTSLRLSTGVTLAANLDPVRIAEDYATLDAVSGGRAEPVFGRGNFFPYVFAGFGQDEQVANERFAESVELVQRLWTDESVTWAGQFRSPLNEATVHPRPTQTPPPMWIGGGLSTTSVDLAARLGCRLMLPTVFGHWGLYRPAVERYIEQWEANGRDPSDRRIGACTHFFVADDSGDARRRWLPRYQAYLSSVTNWQNLSARQAGKSTGLFKDGSAEKNLSGVAICGSVEEVIDRMGQLHQELQIDTHLLMFDMGGMPDDELFEAIELTGSAVLPTVSDW